MNDVLTVDNFPMVLLGKTLSEKEFEYVEHVEIIAGKTIIINRVGLPWLYMGDDHRREVPQQIIAKRIGSYEMGFLGVEEKRAIRLLNYKHV